MTAALLLHATPAQMGTLVALQAIPFALFSLPVGVWLDRRSKLPILLWSEFLFPFVLASIPIAYFLNMLSIPLMYTVSFLTGVGFVVGGTAGQVFLTYLVGREHLLDAQSKFAASDSAARLLGPGLAGLLIQWLTAPFAILVDAGAFLLSWWNLTRIRNPDPRPAASDIHPLREMADGIAFVRNHPTLWSLAWGVACWQILFYGYLALQVLFATRELEMTPGVLGAAQMLGGLGVLTSSLLITPCSRRFGTGNTILIGIAVTAMAWVVLPGIPTKFLGTATGSAIAYGIVIFIFDCGVMLFIMPYLALRLKLTPDAMLARMVSTMRFMTVASAPLGAVAAGWIAEHFGIRTGLTSVAVGGVALTLLMLFASPLRKVRE